MRACIPKEALPAIPLAVVMCLEQVTDITKQSYSMGIRGDSMEVSLNGTSFETFLLLRNAGGEPSWQNNNAGWSCFFYKD